MTKKILTTMFALVAMATTAGAENYNVAVGGVWVSDDNKDNLTSVLTEAGILKSGTVAFTVSEDGKNKLTLNGAKIQYGGTGWMTPLQTWDNLTIELIGDNESVSTSDGGWAYGWYHRDGNLTLTGTGSLKCVAASRGGHIGILNECVIVVDGPTIEAVGYNVGIYGSGESAVLQINAGTLKASCADAIGGNSVRMQSGAKLQLGEGVKIASPAGAIVSEFGVVYANGSPVNVEVVISGGTTGIEANNREPIANDRYYTLDGKKLQGEPTKKGVYIIKGKKVKREFP